MSNAKRLVEVVIDRCSQSEKSGNYTLKMLTTSPIEVETAFGTKTEKCTYYINGIKDALKVGTKIEFDLNDYDIELRETDVIDEDTGELINITGMKYLIPKALSHKRAA